MNDSFRIAVDIGGTFTDLVLERGGKVVETGKALTTSDDPSRAVVDGVKLLLRSCRADQVVEVLHGTTLVSNALIERKGVPTALITSDGFRDVLAMAREQRFDLYDLFIEQPEPLVPRRWRWEVTERILADGTVDIPLDEGQVDRLCGLVSESGVRSLAVCLLHSYRDPTHERRVRDLVRQRLPDVSVCISSEVSPEIGEYHRVSTTVANAYVLPVIDSYLATLETRLQEIGISAPIRIMLSNGGLATTDTARRFPVRLLESGPAAGVLSAAYQGSVTGKERLFAFDMGGTTAKAAIVEGGRPLLSRQHEAARVYRFANGSGLPIRVPVIDMIEIGAGGGSIARVGLFGLPKVGPDSASAHPGPAAYGLGGVDPTVTDADLVLGYLSEGSFLGGDMPLDVGASRSALASLASDLGGDIEDAAAAVHRVVNENMASAARMHAIERGRDIRSATLVATGGAGPVHAWGVARALGIRRLVFPPRAGVASAFGMLAAPSEFQFARSAPSLLDSVDWHATADMLDELAEMGAQQLEASSLSTQEISIAVDVRFQGQGEPMEVEVGSSLPNAPAPWIAQRFAEAYLAVYGALPNDVEPEVLTWRVTVSGPRPRPDVAPVLGSDEPTPATRPMWFAEFDEYVDGFVHARSSLPAGYSFAGPAVVEERESTIVIGPGGRATVGADGNVEVVVDG